MPNDPTFETAKALEVWAALREASAKAADKHGWSNAAADARERIRRVTAAHAHLIEGDR